MTMKEQITEYIKNHTEEMIADVIRLCSIDSEKGPAEAGKPYGAGPYAALMDAAALCESYGFPTTNYDNRVIAADMNDSGARLDILAHVDVVAPGDGWTVTEPYKPIVAEDAIYGRGTADDKGPAVAALYAMRAVKELGLPLTGNCRLILGSEEESGQTDIAHYYKVEKEAPMTFSPDAEFPLINIEKGQFRGQFSAAFGPAEQTEVQRLIRCESGDTINIVPGKAYAELAGFEEHEIEAAIEAVKSLMNDEFSYSIEDITSARIIEDAAKVLALRIEGESAHASTPEKGINAAVIMLQILSEFSFDNREMNAAIKKLAILFPYGDHTGEQIGTSICDEESGWTSVSPDILRIDANGISLKFDSRTCIRATEENTVPNVQEAAAFAGFTFDYTFVKPHAVDGSSDFVKTLLACYEDVSGKKGECLAIGGGTYVHELENGVAFGPLEEDIDVHMHGANEFMPIKALQDAAVIYALAIAKLCR